MQSKVEIRNQIITLTNEFLDAGNSIEIVPASFSGRRSKRAKVTPNHQQAEYEQWVSDLSELMETIS